jgi:hypothetical protein
LHATRASADAAQKNDGSVIAVTDRQELSFHTGIA